MKLEELLDEELYKQVQAAIDAVNKDQEDKLKHIRFADLSEGNYVARSKFDGLQADLNGKVAELQKANDLIEQLKKETGQDAKLQEQISAYAAEVETLKAENLLLKTDNALKFALKDAGAADVDYLVFKAKEKGEIKLDDDGKIKGLDDLITGLKTQHPTQFVSSDPEGNGGLKKFEPNTLPHGDGDKPTTTREQFLQMGYAERAKLKAENPEQYKQFTKKG